MLKVGDHSWRSDTSLNRVLGFTPYNELNASDPDSLSDGSQIPLFTSHLESQICNLLEL
jgi:hypothetical protein